MKNRLIVAAIGIPALLAVIFFTPIWGWGIVVAIMASFCAWELLHTAMPKFVPRFAVYAGVCGAAIVLGAAFGQSELVFKIAAYVLFVTMFVEMMISFHKPERIPFQDLALVFTAGIVIPWMLSSLVRLGLNDPKAPYLLLPFVITWLSDSGAFFVGRSLGKTKLAPALSPHKTVEGCVGGFVCAIAAAFPDGEVLTTRGTIEGIIGYEERGENGFGYDPIFYLPEYGCTSAELSGKEKNKISHRGKALRAIKDELK